MVQKFSDFLDKELIVEIISELWKNFLALDHYLLGSNGVIAFLWVIAFIATLSGLMFSVFLIYSHADMKDGVIEPMELSNTLQ